jgi:hypothetical protein
VRVRELIRRAWRALSRPGLARRGVGAVYLIAFSSLRRQVLGLYGARGILPVRPYLEAIERAHAARAKDAPPPSPFWRWRTVPTLLWFGPSDGGLRRLARVGQVAGAALALGLAPRLAAAVAWACYLSFVSVGRVFLRYQWDVLLLEAGLNAMFGRPRRLLMRLLAVRLQGESGLAKLASRDPTWRRLTACCYHQETQPLPTPLGWYAHHLPRWVQRTATALTLSVECAAPLLAFGPRAFRQAAFAILTGFQGLIALTGNYGFFNWLTVALNLTLIERAADRAAVTGWRRAGRIAVDAVDGAAAAAVVALDADELAHRLWSSLPPGPLARLEDALAVLHVPASYGLFSMMTTTRPEIVVEGSDDGVTWREYGFRYKPGDVARPPRWAAPHHPRLDWQMWFAALDEPPAWFIRFLERLLEGAPEVLALLETNPFPARPPRYVRATLYRYEVADLPTHRRTGAWWVRRRLGTYVPPGSLDGA